MGAPCGVFDQEPPFFSPDDVSRWREVAPQLQDVTVPMSTTSQTTSELLVSWGSHQALWTATLLKGLCLRPEHSTVTVHSTVRRSATWTLSWTRFQG